MLVIIPAFNEEKKIGRVIRGLFENGFSSVLVVDDGSADNTRDVALLHGAKVIRHAVNRGQGAALETGDAYARKIKEDLVVHFDADGQFNPKDIVPAVEFMKEKRLNVVIGSRFLDKRSELPLLKKYLLLPIARWTNFVFTGIMLTDAHNGFRIFDETALHTIKIVHDRMAHNTEIIRQLAIHKLSYGEFPVEVHYDEYGQGFMGGIKIVHDLLIGLAVKKS